MKFFVAASFYFGNLPYFFCQNYRTFWGGVKRGTKGVQAMARKIALKREIIAKIALNTGFGKKVFGAILMPQRSKSDFSHWKSYIFLFPVMCQNIR
jgi:hypothetical protein